MSATALAKGRFGFLTQRGLSARSQRRGLRSRQLRLERLEERSLLSVVSNEAGWAFNIECDSEIHVRDTAVDAAGNLYLVGGFYGVHDFDPGDGVAQLESVASCDGFLVQYHADGTLGWLRHVVQGPTWDEAWGVAVDNDGNVYVCGLFGRSPAQVAGQTLINDSDSSDGFVVKYPVAVVGEEPGEAAWIDQFHSIYSSGSSYVRAFAIEVDNMGHVFAGGTADGDEAIFGSFTLHVDTGHDCWVTRLDAETGTVEWAWDTGPSTSTAFLPSGILRQIVVAPPGPNGEVGGVFACGILSQPIYVGDQLVPGPGGYVTRLDWGTGDVVWAKGMGNDVYGLNLGPDANLYLTGTFELEADFGPYVLTSAGENDIFAAKMNSLTGDFLWAGSVGGPGTDGYENYPPAIAATADGDVYLTGNFRTIADLDPGDRAAILTGGPNLEGFLARIDLQSGSLERLWHFDPIGDGISPCTHLALFTNPDGVPNVYVVGAFRETVEFPVGMLSDTRPNYSDRFVMKFDPELGTYVPAVAAADDSYTYWEDYTLTVPKFEGVLVNDTDANHGSLSVTVPEGSGPQNGTVVMNPDGSFSYTPNANFAGIDTFSYLVSDGHGGTDTSTVTITVNPIEFTPPPTFASKDVPKTLLDTRTTTSTLAIRDAFRIADVNVRLDITHPRDPDLDVFLITPDGTRVELFTDVGTSKSANFTNTLVYDRAAVSITAGKAPFTGAFRPEGSLAAFNEMFTAGTWTLEIRDDQYKQKGTLNSWSLEIAPVDPISDSGEGAAAATLSQLDDQSVDRLLASDELDLAALSMLWETPLPSAKRSNRALHQTEPSPLSAELLMR